MKKNVVLIATFGLVAIFSACTSGKSAEEDLTQYVNPFIGASTDVGAAGVYHGLGKTFPGATTPYGLVQVSPNTITGGDNGSGYSDEHKTIEGFAFTQMSGVGWFGDLGNFLVMPTIGPLQKVAGREDGSIKGYRSAYDKATETAQPGYYSVNLTDYGIKVESSATPHCGILRFTYPQADTARIQIDLALRVGGTSTLQSVEVVNDTTISGWMKCTPDGGGWGNGDGKADYTVHFYATFSKPLTDYGFWSADIPEGTVRKRDEVVSPEYQKLVADAQIIKGETSLEGKHLGFFTEFATEANEQVVVKVGISFVTVNSARLNYMHEIGNKNFDQVAMEANELWNKELNRIKIAGGTDEEKTVFYTALYHTMIDPRVFSDCDGYYIGPDKKIRDCGKEYRRRTIFSGWDVFRSQFPLQTVINPELVSDEINSLVNLAEESQRYYYERWEFLNSYSGCMLGNPALSVIADAYVKGIRTFDVEKAYQYAVRTSNKFGTDSLGYSPEPLSISHTLEYAYFDWCVAELARHLGKQDDYKEFIERSEAYKNLFDQEHGWFRPRNADGSWVAWPGDDARIQEWYGCIEANAYQQGWFVPHDVEGMVELMGGQEAVLADLDNFFGKTPEGLFWNAYYNHANEPVHFVPFLYNRLGEPWKTQKWTRFICRNAYHNRVDGLVGNEDVGQMSAWYVLAASGIHPYCPGDGRMEITSPVFDRIEFKLDQKYYKGDTFVIEAVNNTPENIYIQKAMLNGKEYNKSYLDFADIANGGLLELVMGDKPNENWGMEK